MSLASHIEKISSKKQDLKTFLLNFGPHHPAAHGIIKLSLCMAGDIIIRSDIQVGLLHRGSEKLCESRSWAQIIPYFDRMDYVANLFQEHTIVLSLEQSLQQQQDISSVKYSIIRYVRTLCDELSRILNHLLTVSAICLDLGAMGPIFWAFEEREFIMEFFECLSGARMHTALYYPYSIALAVNKVVQLSVSLIVRSNRAINCMLLGLINNRALKVRLSGVGFLSKNKLQSFGITGIIARASGLAVDLRLGLGGNVYSAYSTLTIKTFLGKNGDCYERLVVRTKEIFESYLLTNCILYKLTTPSFFKSKNKQTKYSSMESLINHFLISLGNKPIQGHLSFSTVEGPKGFVGSTIITSGSTNLYRVAFKSPVAHNLQLLPTFCNVITFADFVAIFCSMDVVLGEIDR